MKVQILFVENDGSIEVGAEYSWDGKKVTCKTHIPHMNKLMTEGYRYKGKKYTEKDGEDFIKMMPHAFSGSRMCAQIVK